VEEILLQSYLYLDTLISEVIFWIRHNPVVK
jgi:hypothetical protein